MTFHRHNDTMSQTKIRTYKNYILTHQDFYQIQSFQHKSDKSRQDNNWALYHLNIIISKGR